MPPSLLRLYVPVYSATLLLSAFLLFGVQPLFGKMVLPLLGGAPGVWNTAMLFFQAMLLAGYAYAHATSRLLTPRAQAGLQIALLLIFTVALPLAIPDAWREPPATSNPAFWQIAMMTVAVGGPFFVLAATAPMLQRWFAATDHPDAGNPYFLYAASNLGSMTALLLYPLVFEPAMTVAQQTAGWSGGYALLIALTLGCALMTPRGRARAAASPVAANDNPVTWRLAGLWLLLSFVPSSLMLGVTTAITTDLASAPLLWIVPLLLYVGTFVIAFARVRVIRTSTVTLLQGVALTMAITFFAMYNLRYELLQIPLHLALFFLTALMCHMQLAQLRPEARHLTAFYLILSAGGVLGGIFNALVAPQIFHNPTEYTIVLGLSAFLRYLTSPSQSLKAATASKPSVPLKPLSLLKYAGAPLAAVAAGAIPLLSNMPILWAIFCAYGIFTFLMLTLMRRWAFALTVAVLLMLYPGYHGETAQEKFVATGRNFFGILRVIETAQTRDLSHGTTLHGTQALDPAHQKDPLSYYHYYTPAGDIFDALNARPAGAQAVAALGLGVGSIACHSRAGRRFDFYEIDPDVAAIARNTDYFTYLSGCGSPYDIIIGDARLQIGKAPDASYDLIFLDVFSSDNIPVHVMTRDAFETYRRKLKPGGMIAVNISNRHLELRPEIAAIARDLGMEALFKYTDKGRIGQTGISYSAALYAVMAEDADTLRPLMPYGGWTPQEIPPGKWAWSDDYSNIIGALRILQRGR